MRVVRDAIGDVSRDGTLIHKAVRILQDDKKRVAVFLQSTRTILNIYGPDEVTYTVSRKPCACKGDPPKMTLMRLWDAAERQAANA